MAEIIKEVKEEKNGFFTKVKNIWKKISVPLATGVLTLITIRKVKLAKKIEVEQEKVATDKKEIAQDIKEVVNTELLIKKDLSDITEEVQSIKETSEKENQELLKFLPGLNK